MCLFFQTVNARVCCAWEFVCVFVYVLHGSFLPLLQSLPVFLQGADGVPRLAAGPPQRAVSQKAFRVGFYDKDKERERKTDTQSHKGKECLL